MSRAISVALLALITGCAKPEAPPEPMGHYVTYSHINGSPDSVWCSLGFLVVRRADGWHRVDFDSVSWLHANAGKL